jgi:ComF family protein
MKTSIFARFVFYLREYFFPAGCACCGGVLLDSGETWYGLCGTCRGELDAFLGAGAQERCERCGRPLVSEKKRCLSCRNQEEKRDVDRVMVLFPYVGKFRRILGAYKFGKHQALGHYFAEKTAKAAESLAEGLKAPVLVPVPPRPGKIRKTGWDQIEHLARLLEKPPFSGINVQRRLKRLPSVSQKELDRKNRLVNLKGRVILTKTGPKPVNSGLFIVFDDVITTGSTLEACAAALKGGGAGAVYGICLFYD